MSWELLESGRVNDVPLDLYRSSQDDGSIDYMIRAGGMELMNSRWHRSEKDLARWGAHHLCAVASARPKILIGGLGLGFTLAAFLETLGAKAELLVAEQSSDVLRWYDEFFRPLSVGALNDGDVHFIHGDVREAINTEGPLDLIVLDVDNGPEPVSGECNRALYENKGLLEIRERLTAAGTFLLWSAFLSPEFEARARETGFEVEVHPVDVGLRDHQHFIYACHPITPRV